MIQKIGIGDNKIMDDTNYKISCDLCDRDALKQDGTTWHGAFIIIDPNNPQHDEVESRWGRTKFSMCHICLLEKLGFKERAKNNV